jgi:oligopeptide transport system permease protein
MDFLRYLAKKFLIFTITLFFVVTLTFVLMRSIPGDPFSQEQAIPEEIMKSLNAHYGLDKPLYIQYVKYLKGIVTGDLGPSLKYEGRTVGAIIKEGFPISAILGLFALVLSLFWGILWGSIAAFFRGRWQDQCSMTIAVLGMSVPSFIMATLLQYFFAIKLDLLPIARWGTFSHMILPGMALSGFPSAFIARLTRNSMIEVLEKDYILTARAKGLLPIQIWRHHVLKNSLLPIVAYLGTLLTNVVTGSFVVEKIFGIPGLGCWLVSSIGNRDYTVILGLTVFYAVLLMSFIFIVDLLYLVLDPRIKNQMLEGRLNEHKLHSR